MPAALLSTKYRLPPAASNRVKRARLLARLDELLAPGMRLGLEDYHFIAAAPVYDGTQRTSDYLTLADGTRLAYDLVIPTKKGVLADKPLPVLFKYTPYGRTWTIFEKNGTSPKATCATPTASQARPRSTTSASPTRLIARLTSSRLSPGNRSSWTSPCSQPLIHSIRAVACASP